MFLKQSTAQAVVVLMVDSADHVTGKTGLTLTITASKDGAALGSISPVVTELAGGLYSLALTTSHTDTLGALTLHITSTGADPTDVLHQVIASDPEVAWATGTALVTAQADLDDIQTRLPAALVGGRIDASVGAMAANVLTATAINADAITAAKVADGAIDAATFAAGAINAAAIAADAITDAKVAADVTIASVTGAVGSVTGAVGSVTGNVGGNVTGSVGSVATGGITAASIAADAIGASELAADAVTEIQSGLATAAALVTAQADLDDIQTRIPATLVSGRIDASVGAMASGVVTATAIAADAIGASELAADAVAEIQSGLATASALSTAQTDLDDIQTRLPAALVGGRIDASVGAMAANVVTATAIAADAITDAKVAADVTIASVTGAVGSVTGSVGSVVGAVGSVAADGITAASIAADAIGASELAADAVTEIQSGLATAAALSTAQSDVTAIKGFVDTEVASILAAVDTEVGAIKTVTDALPDGGALTTLQADLDDIQTRLPAALVSGRIDASVGAVADDALTAASAAADLGAEIAAAVRTELATELARIDAAISTRLATAGYTVPDNTTITAIAGYIDTEVAAILAAVDTEVAAIKAKTDNLPASPSAVGSAMTLDLTQAVPTSNTAQTLGDALNAARAQGFGKWALVGTALTLYAADGTTAVRTFTLDSSSSPTSRT